MCTPENVYRADGAMGQFTIVDPDRDLIIAITENAAGAHWAQTTLDVIWKFIEQIPLSSDHAHDSTCPVSESSRKLKQRLKSLALPAPAFCPYSPLAPLINGKTYQFPDDSLHFKYIGMIHHMTGRPSPSPVSSVHFAISDTSCDLTLTDREGAQYLLCADMCGSCRQNTFNHEIPNQALASACWENDHTLALTLRWIETCNTVTYHMSFDDTDLTIRYIPADSFDAVEKISCGKRI